MRTAESNDVAVPFASRNGDGSNGELRDSGQREHFVQFYENDTALVESVASFIGGGLGAGQGAFVIATPEHRRAIWKRLADETLDLKQLEARGRLVMLDAAETLSLFMSQGYPDGARFKKVIGTLLEKASQRSRGLRLFGEMVALLKAGGNGAAAIRLEELWNDLRKEHEFELFCAYPLDGFSNASDAEDFQQICDTHSHVLPTEKFLGGKDADRLREIAALEQKAIALETEIKERNRVEAILRDSEERQRQLLSLMPSAVYTCDDVGRITFFNRRAAELWGREPNLGDNDQVFCGAFKLWLPDGSPLPHRDTPMAAAVQTGASCRDREVVIERPDGSTVTVNVNIDPIFDPAGRLRGAVNVFQDITARKQAQTALLESKALLEAQKDAFQVAMTGGSLEEALGILARKAVEFSGGRARAAFYVTSPDGKALHHVVGMHEHYAQAIDAYPVSLESMACGLAVHTGQPVITRDIEQDPRWEEFRWLARRHEFRACWSFPVRTKDSPVLGTLAMYLRDPAEPTASEMEAAAVIAHSATLIISRYQQLKERERAEQALRKRGERLELLSETLGQLLSARDPETIVREFFPKVAAHLGVDTYFNFMVDETGDALRLHSCAGIPEETARSIERLEFGQAICGTVAQTRQPIHATDIQNSDYDKAALVRGFGIQSYACHPLMAGDRLLGTLSFASRTRTAFDPDELQFLRMISQYTAVAVDRLQTTRKLRESEERFRAVLNNSTAIVFVKDPEGRYLLVNRCYEDVFRLPEHQVVGKTDFDFFPAEVAQPCRANDLRVFQAGEPMEFEEIVPRDDGLHTYISIKFPLRRADGSIYAIAGMATDITARKRAEEGAARLAAIVEHSDDAIFSANLDGVIDSWNAGAERLYGYSTGEIIGQSIVILVPEGRADEEPGIIQRIRNGESVENFETQRRRKDGAIIDVSLTVSPIKDATGKIIGASKVARDITEKVRAKEKLEQTVAERTASLREAIEQMQEFSYSVSHDLRAPLRAMKAYAGVLLEDYGHQLDETARGYLQKIERSSERMNRLTEDVLAYSRVARSQAQPEIVELERLVRDVLHQHTNLQPPAAEIQILAPLPAVLGHETTLGQSVSNLLNNAVKFVAPGVKPQVRVHAERLGKNVRLWFQDNGIGIQPQHQQRIFNMFERVHPDGRYDGTGIGLTIVRKAVEKMGGKVGVESDGRNGSRFWIELRAAD